jgi:aspartyl-tRNA(Asn)/glutamyl-tRNA(Gln) amidotransferase subunit B
MIQHPEKDAKTLAQTLNLIQSSDSDELKTWAEAALAKFPQKVTEYKNGKKGILGLFMGEVMKISQGKADPKLTTKILEDLLK